MKEDHTQLKTKNKSEDINKLMSQLNVDIQEHGGEIEYMDS